MRINISTETVLRPGISDQLRADLSVQTTIMRICVQVIEYEPNIGAARH